MCLVLCYYAVEKASPDAVLSALQEALFQTNLDDRELASEFLRHMVSMQDRPGLAVTLKWFTEKLDKGRREISHLSSKNNWQQRRIEELEKEKAVLTETEQHLRWQVSSLEAQLAELREQARVTRIHSCDDLSRQRAHTLGLLEDDVQMLVSDSLTALTRNPPKISVARTYMENVLDKITEEIAWLKS